MRTARLLAVLGTLIASAASAEGPVPASFTVISPIFGQLVRFSMPSSFIAVGENTRGGHYLREAVPKGESAERWSQMITVTGAKGLAGNPDISPQALPARWSAAPRPPAPTVLPPRHWARPGSAITRHSSQ